MTLEIEGCVPLLEVFDMGTSVAFYRDVLGFDVVATSGPLPDCGWALLRKDGTEVMLNTAYDEGERPPAPDPARVAAHRDTALFFGCRDVDGAHAHLASKGLRVDPPVTQSYGMRQLYVTDPDGYNLCFQWRA